MDRRDGLAFPSSGAVSAEEEAAAIIARHRPRAGTLPTGANGSTPSARPEAQRHLSNLNPASGSLSTPVSGGNTPNPDTSPSSHLVHLRSSRSASLASSNGHAGAAAASAIGGPGSGSVKSGPKSSASSSDLAGLRARARAGTVALPPPSSGPADQSSFGSGVFSAIYTPRSTGAPRLSDPTDSAMATAGTALRSDASMEGGDGADAAGAADHVRDLISHLGLDTDSPISPPSKHATLPAHPQSAQMTALRSHDGRPRANELVPPLSPIGGRLRASTVSGMMPPPMPPLIRRNSPLTYGASDYEGSSGFDLAGYVTPLRGRLGPGLDATPVSSDGRLLYSSSTSSAAASRAPSAEPSPERILLREAAHLSAASFARPRASTLGGPGSLLGTAGSLGTGPSALHAAAARARAGTLASISNPNLLALATSQNRSTLHVPATPPPAATSLMPDKASLNASALGFVPNASEAPWGHAQTASRPLTPEGARTPSFQQPSRSLWIGGLDPKTTAQELMAVFSCYGHIESLRLLPDKECGFVNFVSVHDALRARDDVLGRLGGHILLRQGPTHVRIGFGKPESAPPTPASAIANGRAHLGPAGAMTPLMGATGEGPSSVQTSPTRALWIGSIPAQTTSNHLLEIFSGFGAIESARVLTHKNCGFVNFEHLDDAVRARKALNGREILGSEVGAVKIGFAKVPVKAPGTFHPGAPLDPLNSQPTHQMHAYDTLAQMRGASTVPLDQQLLGGGIQDYRSNLAMSFVPNGIHAFGPGFQPPPPNGLPDLFPPASLPSVTEMQLLMRELSGGEEDEAAQADEESVAEFRPPTTYYTTVPPPINADDPHRRFAMSEAPRLRDIRKRIDSSPMSAEELDQLATELLDEIVFLSSDYIGNTIVQKLFERCTTPVRRMMLDRVAPHLAIIGCHKNGTWAAQKIIDCAVTPEEVALVCQSLKPFSPPLLLDPLGNYVMQCTLRFKAPANDFVYDCMVDRCWEISQGRFGARSMRTCLDSEHASAGQVKRVAIAIILNSIPLATNPNGALLLTWLLDSSELPGRYRLLAPRLAPHLSHLCTHKLASLTVLRIVNQRVDPDASKSIIDALFNSQRQVLEEVLGDQVHGITVIQKILSSPFVDQATRPSLVEKAKEVLLYLRVQNVPAYRRLAEELGVGIGVAGTPGSGSPAMLGRAPPRPTMQPLPGWASPPPQAPPLGPPLGFGGPYDPTFRPFMPPLGSMMPPPPMAMTPPQRGSPQGPLAAPMPGHPPPPMAMPFAAAGGSPVGGSPLGRQMSPLPPGSPVQYPMQIGSPDPFSALRYHQSFSFGPNPLAPAGAGVMPAPPPVPPMSPFGPPEYMSNPRASGVSSPVYR